MLVLAGAYFVAAWASSASTLVIGTTEHVGTGGIEPADNFDYFGFHILQQTHEGLCTLEPGTANIIAELAVSCDPKTVISADGLTYTFTLRSGTTFTDGTPLTAANVAYSFKRNLALDGEPVDTLLIDDVKDATATGPLTVQITLKQPDGTFLSRIAGNNAAFILSFNSVTKDKNGNDVGVDKNTGQLLGAPDLTATEKVTETAANGTIGTGPYILTQYVPGQLSVFQAYPDYWGCKVTPQFKCPNIAQVVEEHFNTSPAMSASLQDGSVDLAWKNLAVPDIAALQGNPKFLSFQPPSSSSVRYIVLHVGKVPTDDLRVRKAIALAVDRDAIVSKVFNGVNPAIYSMVPVGFPGEVDVWPKRDVAAASTLLQQAGFTKDKPLSLDLWFETSGHYGTSEPDVAAVIKDSLSQVPELKVNLQPIDFPGLRADQKAGSINFSLLGWFPDYLDPLDFIDPFLGTGSHSFGIDFPQLTDKGLDALPADSLTVQLLKAKGLAVNGANIVQLVDGLLHDATVSSDPATRVADFENLQKIWADVVATVPLWGNLSQFITLTQKNIGGVVYDASLWLRDWLITKS
jgi:peptide/nickel transport system substrate-binding protein